MLVALRKHMVVDHFNHIMRGLLCSDFPGRIVAQPPSIERQAFCNRAMFYSHVYLQLWMSLAFRDI